MGYVGWAYPQFLSVGWCTQFFWQLLILPHFWSDYSRGVISGYSPPIRQVACVYNYANTARSVACSLPFTAVWCASVTNCIKRDFPISGRQLRIFAFKWLWTRDTSWRRNTRWAFCAVINPLDSKGNYSAISNNMKLVHWPLMGGLLHLVQRWGAYPSTASVQITVLLYDGPLLCGLNVAIKGLIRSLWHAIVRLVCLRCVNKSQANT